MTFFFIPWRPVISRFAQNAAHHSCSSVFKASVGCPIFPRLDAQTVDARKPSPTTTTGLLRMATKPVLISLGYLLCAPQAISESWIRYSRFGPLVAGTSQNAPPAVSESPRGIAEKLLACHLDSFTVRQDLSGAKVRQSHGFTGLPAGLLSPFPCRTR